MHFAVGMHSDITGDGENEQEYQMEGRGANCQAALLWLSLCLLNVEAALPGNSIMLLTYALYMQEGLGMS